MLGGESEVAAVILWRGDTVADGCRSTWWVPTCPLVHSQLLVPMLAIVAPGTPPEAWAHWSGVYLEAAARSGLCTSFPFRWPRMPAPFSTSQQSPWYPPLIVFRKDLLLTPSLLPHLPSPNLHFFSSSCSCAKSNSNSSRRRCKSNRFYFPHCWLGFWLFLNVLFSFIHLFSCFLHVFIVVLVSFQWGGKD